MTSSYNEKKQAIIRKAIEDRKTIVTIRSSCGNEPIAFDSQKKFDAYKKKQK